MSQFNALAAHYDELMEVVPYDSWADYVMMLFHIADHAPKRLLECACGTGNVSFQLAKTVPCVVGVDIAGAMIEVANRKIADFAGQIQGEIRFFEADLTQFSLGETFDCATCLYDSLNYILEPAKLEAAFGQIAAHVEDGGVFVFDMNSDYALTADLFTQHNRDPRRSLHYDWRATFDENTRVTTVDMLFTRFDGHGQPTQFSEQHRERAYELPEIEAMLARTGWEIVRIYDAYTLNLPHSKSERWFFVVRKAASPRD